VRVSGEDVGAVSIVHVSEPRKIAIDSPPPRRIRDRSVTGTPLKVGVGSLRRTHRLGRGNDRGTVSQLGTAGAAG
jgi:hypothetical protein